MKKRALPIPPLPGTGFPVFILGPRPHSPFRPIYTPVTSFSFLSHLTAPGILTLCVVYDGEVVGWGRESERGEGFVGGGGICIFSLTHTASMLLMMCNIRRRKGQMPTFLLLVDEGLGALWSFLAYGILETLFLVWGVDLLTAILQSLEGKLSVSLNEYFYCLLRTKRGLL